ncbi:propionyl-CoA synthetase [Candidatus Pacearchaeota archaeon]|nr:propionyl-CoA synthetase [Candidatus Pacearchaeota archaeon]
MVEDKVVMMVAAGKVLEYMDKKPRADVEQILRYVMKEIKADKKEKIGAIAAANLAIKFKQKNPEAANKKIMQEIMNEIGNISKSINNEDYYSDEQVN